MYNNNILMAFDDVMIERQQCLERTPDLIDLSQIRWVQVPQQQWDFCSEEHPALAWH